jgi:hypothetical protein
MSSNFDSLFLTYAAPALMTHLAEGEDAEYLAPLSTTPGQTQVILGAEQTEESAGEDGREHRQVREACFPRRVGDLFASGLPALGAVVTIDDVEYAVESIIGACGSMVTVKLVRRGVAEAARPGYRRR